MPPRDEVIHRGSGAMHEATGAAPSAGHGGAESSNPKAEKEAGAPAGAEQEAGAPAAELDEVEAQEEPQDEQEEEAHELVSSNDGDERMVYEPTDPSEPRCPSGDSSSDSEDEAGSPLKREGAAAESGSKRAKISFLSSRGRIAGRLDTGRDDAEEELRSLLATSSVRQILKELDELPEFQLPKAKGRRGLLRE